MKPEIDSIRLPIQVHQALVEIHIDVARLHGAWAGMAPDSEDRQRIARLSQRLFRVLEWSRRALGAQEVL